MNMNREMKKENKIKMNKLHVQATRAFVNTFQGFNEEVNSSLLLVNKALDEFDKSIDGIGNREKKGKALAFILDQFNKLIAQYM